MASVTPIKLPATGSPFNSLGNPSATPTFTSPTPTAIPQEWQPPEGDPLYRTILEWRIFEPKDGAGRWPVVIVLHVGGFRSGSFYEGMTPAPQDLADAGFYTLVASYPLAPPNTIKGQPDHNDPASGRPPEQTNAVKALVNAARADMHCLNSLVGILGGSAGGSHAAFVALDETDTGGAWPNWNTLQRPKFVACLSGVYDISDRTDPTTQFINTMENYTNTVSPLAQWNASPIAHISQNTNFIPMYFIHSEADSMPPHQQWDMFNALHYAGASPSLYQMWTIPNSEAHAFAYWDDPIWDTSPLRTDWLVRDRVIGYFKQYLK